MIIVVACVVGCQSKPKQVTIVSERKLSPASQPVRRSSGALAFMPPVAMDQRELQLWRDDRQPSAFVGYDQPIAQYYYVRTDDRQNFWGDNDIIMRRAVTVKMGMTSR